MKSILIYGGSFDPIHNGHLDLVNKAQEQIKASKVIFELAKGVKGKELTDPLKRYEMLLAALKGHSEYRVGFIELRNKDSEYSYSYDTLTKYRELYPDYELIFLMGMDQANKFATWYKAKELKSLATLYAVAREGIVPDMKVLDEHGIKILDVGTPLDVSSTSIKEGSSLNVPRDVITYIVYNRLYFMPKVREYYEGKRYKHALSVASVAYDIALSNGLEPTKAYLAGLYHDICKRMTKEECQEILKGTPYERYSDYPEYILHQFAGAIEASKTFKVEDREILEAISYHTTGAPKMGKYAKILYAADKIEPLRGYDSSEMMEAMKKDVDSGFSLVLRENKAWYTEHNYKFETELQQECYDNYSRERGNEDE